MKILTKSLPKGAERLVGGADGKHPLSMGIGRACHPRDVCCYR